MIKTHENKIKLATAGKSIVKRYIVAFFLVLCLRG